MSPQPHFRLRSSGLCAEAVHPWEFASRQGEEYIRIISPNSPSDADKVAAD
jgi:hypothetical protein